VHAPVVQATAWGGAHGGTINLQPCDVNCAHWALSTLSCAAFSAELLSARIERLHESKHEALRPMLAQSLACVHARCACTTASTSCLAPFARSLHDMVAPELPPSLDVPPVVPVVAPAHPDATGPQTPTRHTTT
jgi:hypothetical protein